MLSRPLRTTALTSSQLDRLPAKPSDGKRDGNGETRLVLRGDATLTLGHSGAPLGAFKFCHFGSAAVDCADRGAEV